MECAIIPLVNANMFDGDLHNFIHKPTKLIDVVMCFMTKKIDDFFVKNMNKAKSSVSNLLRKALLIDLTWTKFETSA